jgi:hypothetical protein
VGSTAKPRCMDDHTSFVSSRTLFRRRAQSNGHVRRVTYGNVAGNKWHLRANSRRRHDQAVMVDSPVMRELHSMATFRRGSSRQRSRFAAPGPGRPAYPRGAPNAAVETGVAVVPPQNASRWQYMSVFGKASGRLAPREAIDYEMFRWRTYRRIEPGNLAGPGFVRAFEMSAVASPYSARDFPLVSTNSKLVKFRGQDAGCSARPSLPLRFSARSPSGESAPI